MSEKDPWKPPSGLLSDYEGTVVDAWFGIDTQYNPDTTLLWLKMKTDVPEHPEFVEKYSCGGDWKSYDGGKTIEHPKQDTTNYAPNKNSAYGKFITASVDLAGDELKGRGVPTDASIWVGTKWFMEAVDNTFVNRQTGEKVNTQKNFPSRYLGTSEIPDTVSERPAAATTNSLGITGEQETWIRNHAKDLPFGDWVDTVMDGIEGMSPELAVALADEDGLYKDMRNG